MDEGSDFQVRVRYFAAARELVGAGEEAVILPDTPSTAAAVLALVGQRHPRLRPHLRRMRLAVNGELVDGEAPVRGGDELDVLPPVAGGGEGPVRLCEVREGPLSVDECMKAVAHEAAGAVAVFTGVVRDHADGKPVARLDYEAHPELADREMHRILVEIAREKPAVRLAAVHRVGELAVGELAVVVAAGAPHRAEAFDACRDAIERIKADVPIWKKEWAPDGAAHWVNLD
ncbi:MAG: molybdenum cofactor biosynthesis protein [Myxococcota bacterium]